MLGIVPQTEVDKQTHIENRYYLLAIYNKFSATKKARLWQLRNLCKTPGSGLTSKTSKKTNATTVAELTSASSTAVSQISELAAATRDGPPP